MKRKRWPLEIINKARELRQKSATFGEIRSVIPVSKSTLHEWVKDIKHPDHIAFSDRKKWITHIQSLAVKKIKENRQKRIKQIIDRVENEVQNWNNLNNHEIHKTILAFLYWAEGQKLPEQKAPLKFANTDPRLIELFVTLLEKCYHIDRKKLKIMLYLHWYHNETMVKKYWKDLLQIEDSQFRKTFWKKRSKTKRFRKNFMGICFIIYQNVDLRHEIMNTAYTIYKKMLINLRTSAPVA